MTLANSISAPAIAASAAVSGQGARPAVAGASVRPSMFAEHLGAVGGDVSARALSVAKGAPVNVAVAGHAMAGTTTTVPGTPIAGAAAAATGEMPAGVPVAGLAMFDAGAGPAPGSVRPATSGASANGATGLPASGTGGAAAATVDPATGDDFEASAETVSTVTLASAAPASMSAPFLPVSALAVDRPPAAPSAEGVLPKGQAVSAPVLAALAGGAGGPSNDTPGTAHGAGSAEGTTGTAGSAPFAQGNAGSPPGLAPGSVAALAGGTPASVGAPAVGAALAAGNPVSAQRSATVTDAATAAGSAQTTGAVPQPGAGQSASSPEPSPVAQQTAPRRTAPLQAVAATSATGAAVPAPQTGPVSGAPEQTVASAISSSAASAGGGSVTAGVAIQSPPPSVADETAVLSGVTSGEQAPGMVRPRSAVQGPTPAVAQSPAQATATIPAMTSTADPAGAEGALSPTADAPASQEAVSAPAAVKSAPQPVASAPLTGQDGGTVAVPRMAVSQSPAASGSVPEAAEPASDGAAQTEAAKVTGAGDDTAPARDPAALRATTQMAINTPARDPGQAVAAGAADALTGEATSTLAKAMAGEGASGEDGAADHKQPSPAPAAALPAQPQQPLRAGVSAAALAFAAALTDGQGKPGDAALDFDGFGDLGLRGDAAQQAAASAARAAATAPLPHQAAAATAHLAAEIARFASKGSTRFQIRMDPPEMGRIDVDLKIGKDGSVRAHLAVERSETLDMFLRDQRSLERALDAAGLKLENGSVQLSLKDQGGFAGFQRQDGQDDGRGAGRGGDGPGAEGDVEELVSASRVHVRGASGALDIQI